MPRARATDSDMRAYFPSPRRCRRHFTVCVFLCILGAFLLPFLFLSSSRSHSSTFLCDVWERISPHSNGFCGGENVCRTLAYSLAAANVGFTIMLDNGTDIYERRKSENKCDFFSLSQTTCAHSAHYPLAIHAGTLHRQRRTYAKQRLKIVCCFSSSLFF